MVVMRAQGARGASCDYAAEQHVLIGGYDSTVSVAANRASVSSGCCSTHDRVMRRRLVSH